MIEKLKSTILRKISTKFIGMLLLFLALIISIGGTLANVSDYSFRSILVSFFNNFYANISSELFSISITILFIDAIYRKHERENEKESLLRDLTSRDLFRTKKAVEELRINGWLSDGSLKGGDFDRAVLDGTDLNTVDFSQANLMGASFLGAYLFDANLSETILIKVNFVMGRLSGANLENSHLTQADLSSARANRVRFCGATMHEAILENTSLIGADFRKVVGLEPNQLQRVYALRGATMPDGSLYLGEMNLPGDLENAILDGVDVKNEKDLLNWYLSYHGE